MDIMKMLADLRAERLQIEEAIIVLQRLASGQGKRRGRPPKWMRTGGADAENVATEPKRKRKGFSAATRAKMAEAQRKRWAEKKKAAS